jgi:hypothetical protein
MLKIFVSLLTAYRQVFLTPPVELISLKEMADEGPAYQLRLVRKQFEKRM